MLVVALIISRWQVIDTNHLGKLIEFYYFKDSCWFISCLHYLALVAFSHDTLKLFRKLVDS
jgi:hypothetical protein